MREQLFIDMALMSSMFVGIPAFRIIKGDLSKEELDTVKFIKAHLFLTPTANRVRLMGDETIWFTKEDEVPLLAFKDEVLTRVNNHIYREVAFKDLVAQLSEHTGINERTMLNGEVTEMQKLQIRAVFNQIEELSEGNIDIFMKELSSRIASKG